MQASRLSPSDLAGRIAVVSGATHAVGRATALHLSRAGAKVVLVGDDVDALTQAQATIVDQAEGASVGLVRVAGPTAADLVQAGNRLLRTHRRVDLLLHLAALGSDEPAVSVDASHALALTTSLMPGLEVARSARVVTATPHSDVSAGRWTSDPGDGAPAGLNLVDFVALLHHHLSCRGSRARSIALDPGPNVVPHERSTSDGGSLLSRLHRRRLEHHVRLLLEGILSPRVVGGTIVTPMFPGASQTMSLPVGRPSPHAEQHWQWAEQGVARRPYAGTSWDGATVPDDIAG